MNKSKNQKNSKERVKKDFDFCINYESCKGKWFRYKAKDNNGYCKACIKNENFKNLGLKINTHGNKLFDCKGSCN